MLSARKLMRRKQAFERLVGLTPEQFEQLLMDLEPRWNRAHRRSLLRADRKRGIGAGRAFKLPLAERLLVTLLYLRQYFTMHVLGMFFDLNDSNICRGIHALLPVLEDTLPGPVRARTLQAKADEPPKKGEKKLRKIRSLDEFVEVFPEYEDLIIDATEQPRGQPKVKKGKTPGKKAVGRPVNKRKFYSAKAGTHTLKVQVGVSPDGLVRHLSASVPGRMHDMRLLRRSRLEGRVGWHVRLWGDRGYAGLEKLYPWRAVIVPAKKPKGGCLSAEARETNRWISKVRIGVENAVCRLKKFRVCREFFRNRTQQHGVLWGCVAGLVNLRLLDQLAVSHT